MLVRMAHCCRPVPGDPLLWALSPEGRGVSIHRALLNLFKFDRPGDDRIIEVAWAEESEGYRACLSVIALDKTGCYGPEMTQILPAWVCPLPAFRDIVGRTRYSREFEIMIQDIDQLNASSSNFKRCRMSLKPIGGRCNDESSIVAKRYPAEFA